MTHHLKNAADRGRPFLRVAGDPLGAGGHAASAGSAFYRQVKDLGGLGARGGAACDKVLYHSLLDLASFRVGWGRSSA
jgi:hypothetical protein